MVRETNPGAFYDKLRKAVATSVGSPLLIFPSASDVDSLCALKIVTNLLVQDSVRYSVYPVAGFQSIQSLAGRSLRSEDDSIVVLLINWGASRNLLQLLQLGSKAQVFVVDSHRPIHLHNLSDLNPQVTILFTHDDETQSDTPYGFPLYRLSSFISTNDSNLDVYEDSESDLDSDSDSDDDGRRRKRRKKSYNDGDDEQRREEELLKAEYYRMGCFHGRPSGCLMFDIAHTLHKNTNELLWLAGVALTDQFVHERLSKERYDSTQSELEGFVALAGNFESSTSVTLKDGTRVRAPDVSRIIFDEEPRLMLLREWSLYEAMMCSFYVAPKLKTWGDSGLKTMKLLIAKMGISLAECQQQYQYMKNETRKGLKQMLEKVGKDAGLGDLYFRNLYRFHGYNDQVSAADVVYGVTALLEASTTDMKKDWTDNFCTALEALSPDKWDHLRAGMQLAIKVQRACMSIGSAAIVKKGEIKMCKAFRYFELPKCVDAELLAHPLSLTKLCYFVMDSLKEQGRAVKPMICYGIIPGPANEALIVGVSHRPRLGATNGNRFGLVFRAIAEKIGSNFSHDAFESSWIHLPSDDVTRFMQELQSSLASYNSL